MIVETANVILNIIVSLAADVGQNVLMRSGSGVIIVSKLKNKKVASAAAAR